MQQDSRQKGFSSSKVLACSRCTGFSPYMALQCENCLKPLEEDRIEAARDAAERAEALARKHAKERAARRAL
eukprot:CAMPEP_0206217784 /NCGR_PEP_ID=MMETSP0047_2-20121206/3453_1 /ASSEMBLY_ACC=CAM_ASM_000192 /TAXON_ID=195065 /ORGANISM="Chroomonas mesostigmatica_cf, Strain CCMP1168" /LENGTH=71 /DNA_ID=CAMNT_0053640249 /DNA_START=84 /DNA_END=296 /DNA_ORIENTATION=-